MELASILIEEVAKLQAEAEQLLERAARKTALADERARALQVGIRSRDYTSGDKITDFVIVRYGRVSKDTERVYRNLDGQVREAVNQLVLVVARGEEVFVCRDPGPSRSEDYGLSERFYLGVLDGNSLNLPLEGGFSFPTGKYVRWGSRYGSPSLSSGCLGLDPAMDLAFNLNRPLELRNPGRWESDSPKLVELEIVIGDEKVGKWFKARDDRRGATFLDQLTRLLN